jgi:parallel beta-helix repeat protein
MTGIWNRKILTILICFSLLIILPSATLGRDWIVNPTGTGGDAATIQAAITSAADHDRIVLTAGTFTGTGNRDVDFLGKGVTVTSQSGPEVTVIDCEEGGRGFIFQNGEGATSVLSGITIENGLLTENILLGGAILCDGASPTIDGNIFRSNTGPSGGGAIACNNSANPAITDNLIADNMAGTFYADDGGGIWIENSSSPVVMDNVISGNSGQKGGGIYCTWSTSPQITGNLISNNGAVNEGGGIWCDAMNVVIADNIIYHNQANGGGGLWVGRGPAEISDNTMCENNANGTGGLYISGSAFNCTVSRTIVAFSTSGDGILSGDGATFTCCLVYGNAGTNDLSFGVDGGNNLFVDPQFCGVMGSAILTLQSDSPCIPANNQCNQWIGALGTGCGISETDQSTWGGLKNLYK